MSDNSTGAAGGVWSYGYDTPPPVANPQHHLANTSLPHLIGSNNSNSSRSTATDMFPHVLGPNYTTGNQNGTASFPPVEVPDFGNIRSWLTEKFIAELRQDSLHYDEPETAVLIALYVISFVLGLVGNILVIYIFVRTKHMRTVTNAFLVNLAVSDLMVVCVCIPFTVAYEVYKNWIYGDVLCKLVHFSQGLSVTSSILTLAVISGERFYAIRRPLKARAILSRTRMRKLIIVIWVVSAVISIPQAVAREVEQNEVNDPTLAMLADIMGVKVCRETWPNSTLKYTYIVSLLVILYFVPLFFIFVGYFFIGITLWRKDSMLHAGASSANSDSANSHLRGRRKIAKMLVIMATLFAISWLPWHIMSICLEFMEGVKSNSDLLNIQKVYTYALWFAHFNSSINPICYCIMSESFQHALKCCFARGLCGISAPGRRQSFSSMTNGSLYTKNFISNKGFLTINRCKPTSSSDGSHSRRESDEVELALQNPIIKPSDESGSE